METKIIGYKIAEARKKMNISQAQLAQHLFISAQAVGKWERGESLPDIITLNRLANILGVDLNYFSENFVSTADKIAQPDPLVKPSAELPPEKKESKLSWNMSHGNWVGADFSGLKNLHDKFSSSNLQRCLFRDSELSGLLLKSNNVDGCDFSGSDISNSHIQNSNLAKNKFNECSLKETKFSGSHISGCDFNGADFTGVVMKSGGIEKNTFANTCWNHTSFIDTYIADTIFEGKMEDCYFENCSFTRVTFQNVNITNTFLKNKSLKKVKFINCIVDRITYAFLKNGKADLSGVTLSE